MGALMIVGAVISAASAMASAKAASNQAAYQAEVARTNANISEMKQRMMADAASKKQAEIGLEDKANYGELAARAAASGLDINTGTPKGVLESQRALSKTRLADYTKESAEKWWGQATTGVGFEAQARLDEMESSNAMTTGYLKAGSSLMSSWGKGNSSYGSFS